MNTLQQIGLVGKALGGAGMGIGIGLVLGGITESCCIGAVTVSIPGLLYLVSASTVTAAVLFSMLGNGWGTYKNAGYETESLVRYCLSTIASWALSLGTYALVRCYWVGLTEQALVAAAIAGVGQGIIVAVSCLSMQLQNYKNEALQIKQYIVGNLIMEIGITLFTSSLLLGLAIAASSALPLVLTTHLPAEMLIAAQWLTVISVEALVGTPVSWLIIHAHEKKLPGFNAESRQWLGALIIGNSLQPTDAGMVYVGRDHIDSDSGVSL